MAEVLRAVTVCDPCLANGEEVETTLSYNVSINGFSKSVDLCEIHGPVVDEVLAMMEFGSDIIEEDVEPEVVEVVEAHPCPLCDYVGPARTTLGSHLKRVHDTGFRALKKRGLD